MTELTEITRPDNLFNGDQLDLVFGSVCCGNTAGRLWLDRTDSPRLGLLWDQGNNVFYLDGSLIDDAERELRNVIADIIHPAALSEGLRTSTFTRFQVASLPRRHLSFPDGSRAGYVE